MPYVLIVGFVCADAYSVVHEALGNVGCGCVVGEDGVVETGSGVVSPEVEIIKLLFCGIFDAGSKTVERSGRDEGRGGSRFGRSSGCLGCGNSRCRKGEKGDKIGEVHLDNGFMVGIVWRLD